MTRIGKKLTACFGGAFLLLLLGGSAFADQCTKEIAPVIKELDARIEQLRKSVPRDGSGRQVDVGSCAARLAKLDGNFLCCKTHQNIAPIWEEMSCLGLKKFYLRKTCHCQRVGGYSADEILQDGVYESYGLFVATRKAALKRGIKNKLIRSYVESAQKALDCINASSLSTLREVTAQIDRLTID